MEGFLFAPPPPFNINDANVGERFAQYKTKFSLFLTANGLDIKNEIQKIAILKILCGEDLLHQIEASEEENQSIADVFQRLENYFIPESNVLQHQFKFFTRKQASNENFDKYFIELKKMIKNCNFGELEDNFMKLALIMNVRDYAEQQKFLKNADGEKLDDLVVGFRKYDLNKESKKKGSTMSNDHTPNKYPQHQQKSSTDSFKKESHKQSNNTHQGNKNNPSNKKPKPSTSQKNDPAQNESQEKSESGGKKKGKNKSSNSATKQPDVFDNLEERIHKLNTS